MFRKYGNIHMTDFAGTAQTIAVSDALKVSGDISTTTTTDIGTTLLFGHGDMHGISEDFTIVDDVSYELRLNNFSTGIGNYLLWISTSDEQNMYAQKLTNEQTTFNIMFRNSKFLNIRIGILFYKPYPGDFFKLKSIGLGPVDNKANVNTIIDGQIARYNIETAYEWNSGIPTVTGPIIMTVGMPIYQASDIVWLALNSLKEQAGVTFAWELILFEEGTNSNETIRSYEGKLPGCVRILYKTIRNKISLLNKWIEIAKSAATTSTILVMQSADDYSPKCRLQTHFKHFNNPACYLSTQLKGLFYNLLTKEKMFYVGKNNKNSHRNNAYRLEYFKDIPISHNMGNYTTSSYIKKHIDQVIHDKGHTRQNMIISFTDDWMSGFFTDGYNMSSVSRQKYYSMLKSSGTFYPYSYAKRLNYNESIINIEIATTPTTTLATT
jgi:hypothetical protein